MMVPIPAISRGFRSAGDQDQATQRDGSITTPSERARALRWAGEFLRALQGSGEAAKLPDHLKRQIPVVLRHYPYRSRDLQPARLPAGLRTKHVEKARFNPTLLVEF